tara:strand:+ start:137 stop:1162 length:1026 start_codon:yes stop_codon:yes gene_type:complete
MKKVTWIFSVGLVALLLGGCGQEDGKSIDEDANEALEENKRLKDKIARMEASKEIDEREREYTVDTPEKNPDPVQALTAEQIEELVSEAAALYDEGKYREAKAKMLQAYADFERLPTKDKATRVRYLRWLCKISDALQENDQAITYATEVAIHAVDDDDRAFAYGLLGQAYYSKGEYDKALEYYEKDLAIGLNSLGAEHPDVANTYNNIGSTYDKKGEYDKAIGYFEKCLAIQLKTLGAEHPNVATTYNNIGLAYSNKGEYDKAIGYYEKSLAIDLKMLGAEHPSVGITYYNIGTIHAKKGDKPKALAYLQKAKAIQLKRLGLNHPNTKKTQAWIDHVNNE